MKKIEKILYVIVTLMEIGLLVGTYILNYYTVKKLGINRTVNFMSAQWEKNYPIPQIKMIVILLLAAFSVLIICIYLKQKASLNKMVGIMVIVMCILSTLSIGYALIFSRGRMRAYYIICLMLAGAAALQLIKTAVGIKRCK